VGGGQRLRRYVRNEGTKMGRGGRGAKRKFKGANFKMAITEQHIRKQRSKEK